MGLSPGCGARTLAAGLALALGRRGEEPFLVSLGPARPASGAVRACEVPAALTGADEVACYGGTLLRLAAETSAASSVWSVPAREAPRAAAVVADVDAVVAVAGRAAEPALSGMVCSLLAERCRRVLLDRQRGAAAGRLEPLGCGVHAGVAIGSGDAGTRPVPRRAVRRAPCSRWLRWRPGWPPEDSLPTTGSSCVGGREQPVASRARPGAADGAGGLRPDPRRGRRDGGVRQGAARQVARPGCRGPRRDGGRGLDARRLRAPLRVAGRTRPGEPGAPDTAGLPRPCARRGVGDHRSQRRRPARCRVVPRRAELRAGASEGARSRQAAGEGRAGARGRVRIATGAEAEVAGASGATSDPGEGGGYQGPFAYRQGKPMRPDVARAFDRLEEAAASRRRRAPDHLGLSLRRRAGAALRAASGPALGGAPGTLAAPAGNRARPRALGRLRLAGAERGAISLRPQVRLGAVALRLHAEPTVDARRHARSGRARRRPQRRAVVRSGRIRARHRPRGEPLERVGVPARSAAATRSPTSTRSPSVRAGAQGIAQFMPATARAYGLPDPFDAAARSTPRPT